ncbi:Kinase, NEK [Giardia duodenalis]|uniref:Kinase, NEK n=1 Tax=Giardia intestinalis (strain ATCC 50803 / WB clone C6) TaxID=184922 RepID=A8B2M6_GIAIC|nr:Kinase, NEK [Giardia intestinalis]KAE8303008.1 Kinase, NEK [Giardia intestinalis]|eukprot:XP_001710006.1 Kinase, NEK [Giardia lamblia ATCC 50803]
MANNVDHSVAKMSENLGEIIGEGSLGAVYTYKKDPKQAIKEIRLDTLKEHAKDVLIKRLCVFQHVSHPHVLEYFWALQANDFVYLSMWHYHESLASLIVKHKREKRPIPEATILTIIDHVTSALAYLHDPNKQGKNWEPLPVFTHQNLKTDNILTNKNANFFVVADCGLCRSALEGAPAGFGSSTYSAPEVLLRGESSTASDMWSLGIIIYELVSLSRPHFIRGCRPTEVFVSDWRPDLSEIADGFLKDILRRLLVLNPTNRLSAIDLANMLDLKSNATSVARKTLPTDDSVIRISTLERKCAMLEAERATLRVTLSNSQSKIEEQEAQIQSLKSACSSYNSRNTTPKPKPESPSSPNIDLLHTGVSSETPSRLAKSSVHENHPKYATMIAAACNNEVNDIKVFLSLGNSIGRRDEHGMTALMHAAQRGHLQIVRMLANKESGLKDETGMTALMHAALGGHAESVSILCRFEVGVTDKKGQSALNMALENGHLSIVKRLIKHEKDVLKWTFLMCAAAKGDVATVKKHLRIKSRKDANGDTALIIAGKAGFGNIVEVIQPTSKKGVTALMQAVKSGDIKTVKALVSLQGGMRTTDCYTYEVGTESYSCGKGYTALMFAAQQGNTEIISELIKCEAKMQTGTGETALMQAARAGKIEAVKMLIDYEKGMKATSTDSLFPCSCTALSIARAAKHYDVVNLLSQYPEERC